MPIVPQPLPWGSFHCQKFTNGGKCDTCSHMRQTDHVHSYHFGTDIKIRGHLSHDYSPRGLIRWYIYTIEDVPCKLIYCGSTQSPVARFSSYKSSCNSGKSKATGLSKHFMTGCPNDTGRQKETLNLTLVDYMDTSVEKLTAVGHTGGGCVCSECCKLKVLEDKFMLRIGSLYSHGLNSGWRLLMIILGVLVIVIHS